MANILKCFGEIGGLHQPDLTKFQQQVNDKYQKILSSSGLTPEEASIKAITESIAERTEEINRKSYAKLVDEAKKRELFNISQAGNLSGNATLNDIAASGTRLGTNVESMSSKMRGILGISQKYLNSMIEYVADHSLFEGSIRAMGLGYDKAKELMLIKAILRREYDIPSKDIDPEAQRVVDAYAKDQLQLSQRGKKAGVKWNYKVLPQPIWDAVRLNKLGVSEWTAMWHEHLTNNVDKYRDLWVDKNGHSLFYDDEGFRSDERLNEFLDGAFKNIASDSENLTAMGKTFHGRLDDAVKLHIRDAEFWQQMNDAFGSHTLTETLDKRLQQSATYLAAVELAGPNAPHNFRVVAELNNEKAKNNAKLTTKEINKQKSLGLEAIEKFEFMNHYNQKDFVGDQHALEKIAVKIMQGSHNLFTTFFGFSNVWGLTDMGSAMMASKAFQASGGYHLLLTLKNFKDSFHRQDYNHVLNEYGFLESLTQEQIARDWTDLTSRGWTTFSANTFSRLAKLSRGDKAKREVYTMSAMKGLGESVAKYDTFDKIPKASRDILINRGITEDDFQVLKKVKLEKGFMTDSLLTFSNIADVDRRVAEKVMGAISLEGDLAVTRPTDLQRFYLKGLHKGTIKGEVFSSMLAAKTFFIAYPVNQLQRIFSMDSKMAMAKYGAGLAIRSIILGMISEQVHNLLIGNDIEDMSFENGDLWKRVVINSLGGGLAQSIGGGLLTGQMAMGGLKPAIDIGRAVIDPIFMRKEDEEFSFEQLGASIAKTGVQYSPITAPIYRQAYTKLFLDRLFMDSLMEVANPGTVERTNRRLDKAGQSSFAPMGEPISSVRLPQYNEAQ